jgi:hypothetical protein
MFDELVDQSLSAEQTAVLIAQLLQDQ